MNENITLVISDPFSMTAGGNRRNTRRAATKLLTTSLSSLNIDLRCFAMDPKVTQLRVDAFDAVKNADGRHQNVQKYLTPLPHGENQMNKEKWTKLWYDPFDEYHAANFQGFLHLAAALILLRYL